MVLVWVLFGTCIGAAAGTFIQQGVKDFDNEDQVLARHLRERMRGLPHDPMDTPMVSDAETEKYFEENTEYIMNILESEGVNAEEEMFGGNVTRRAPKKAVAKAPVPARYAPDDERDLLAEADMRRIFGLLDPRFLSESGRRQKIKSYFPKEPEIMDIKERLRDMMQHQIYATQYRLRDLQHVVDKYSGDIRFRVGYIYCRLETLLTEMQTAYSYMNKTVKTNSAHIHFIYYTHIMKKNIDVTYIVEHMIMIHTKYMEDIAKKFNFDNTNRGRPTIGSETGGDKDPRSTGDAGPPTSTIPSTPP